MTKQPVGSLKLSLIWIVWGILQVAAMTLLWFVVHVKDQEKIAQPPKPKPLPLPECRQQKFHDQKNGPPTFGTLCYIPLPRNVNPGNML